MLPADSAAVIVPVAVTGGGVHPPVVVTVYVYVPETVGVPLIVTYHPAALLRNPNWKRLCWEDVQMLRAHYDKVCPNG